MRSSHHLGGGICSWSCLAAVALAACGGPQDDHLCNGGPGIPGLAVYLSPAFHGAKVTTRGECTQVQFSGMDDRNHEVWEGKVTATEGTCTVTVVTPDGKANEQTVANRDLCGGPQYQRVYFGAQ